MRGFGPGRIVCLTEEPTEVLYAIGQADRIVGISGYTVRPKQARREKPKVSAFSSAKIDEILALRPDLVIGFSDIQADIAHALIKAGIEVWISNHRSIEGIMSYIRRLAAMVGAVDEGNRLVQSLAERLDRVWLRAQALAKRPKVYFEEWDDPQITAIQWVSELIEIAGGHDVFAELGQQPLAAGRIIRDAAEVPRRAPDIIIGSWCGKKFRPERVAERPGWQDVPAIRHGELHEIKSPIILQPGPAALSDGLEALSNIVEGWAQKNA